MANPDRRTTFARPDLAAEALRGRVEADRYAVPRRGEIVAAVAPLRAAPRPDQPLDTEAVLGEAVDVLEDDGEGWAFVQLAADGYVGYMPAEAIGYGRPAPTHQVTALRSLAFPAAELRLPVVRQLVQGARVAVVGSEEKRGLLYARLADGTATVMKHLAPLDGPAAGDYVTVAEAYVGTPYQWGGKTSLGIDCSGLVQVALAQAGVAAPRDTDMQEAAIGTPIDWTGDTALLRRGDLLFWKGHVGIALGDGRLLHASGFQMATAIEPLDGAIARIAAAGLMVTSVRRP